MVYAIQNESGAWWTGTCWGVKDAREVYRAAGLPRTIEAATLLRCGRPSDYLYCTDSDSIAAVRRIKK